MTKTTNRTSTILMLGVAAIAATLAACSQKAPVTTQSSGTGATNAGGTVAVAAGTDFYGKLQAPIGSKTSHDGDTFALDQTDTFLHKNAALHGAVVESHLTNISPAGPAHSPSMTLVFDDIKLPDGTKSPVDVQLVSVNAFEPKTHHLRTIGMMIAGAMAGHAVASHSHGGLMGAAAGYVLSQELKTDIAVPAGSVIELKFKSPVTTGG
ncbi:MAG TPA: hypothetical protein VEV38_03410 [Candidatus Eremiobacteraceae bacterium]|nr:hypothetical protein [Candidatus Eremiobacteraceae bacterium]